MAAVPQAILKTIMIFLCLASAVAKFETFTRRYLTFNLSMIDQANRELRPENYATIHNDALQITPDTSNPGVFSLQNQSGRMMLLQSFKLWDDDNSVASFSTYFLVNMFPSPTMNSTPGEGLAFLISPTLGIPNNSYGQYLGLTNSDTDNQTTNGIVAVELDTVKQSFDPDNNHIGLNIHSIDSVVSKSLTPLNIILASPQPVFHNVWIEYNGLEKFIRVYIANHTDRGPVIPPRPETPILEYQLNLQETVQKYSYFGFAASTGTSVELNCVLRWDITVQHIMESDSNSNSKSPLMKLLLSVGIPLVVVLGLGAYFGYYWYKRRLVDRSNSHILNRLRTLPGMPKEFRFKELKKATNNFDEKRKLGQGGYGVVYHGLLSEDNGEVAVKWFSRESLEGEYDFLAELTIINRLRHKHLVRLLGEFLSVAMSLFSRTILICKHQ
ncbi:lectin-receptor kinase [Artemisia annua]|uniref:non-specific serine/threonine protein kinase n=1 Tax=Artemisia annua TaxID=35608 RepID=A0A2U1KAW6_ARTAN|nr:lectin-receptor kinase [Artemisia annua]